MYDVDDWELVARAQAGDETGFAELMRRYQRPVLHYCARMTRSVSDAEELAQETFVRLFRYLPRLRPEAKFTTALFGIAHNLTLNHLRNAQRRSWLRFGLFEKTPEPVAPSTRNPDEQARGGEIEAALAAAMARLTPEHRAVLMLREFEGFDYDAIAAVLGCRKGTVRSRLARAREQLRLYLLEAGADGL